jgi:uncharacterized membrane protein
MSFRETNAWIALASIGVVFGLYFARVGAALRTGSANPGDFLNQYIGSVVLLVILEIALGVMAAIATRTSPASQAMRDERERIIELKANRCAFPVVQIGVVITAAAISLGAPAFVTANALVLALVVGEVVRLGGQIVYFRLGV